MQLLKINGELIGHKYQGERCPGSGKRPAEAPSIGVWLPLLPQLTPHGLRHGHQTWMDEGVVPYVLQSERMGHEVPGMRGTYSHVSPIMRANLIDELQSRWEQSLKERAAISSGSLVPALDRLLKAL
ncbi:hypothetical protein ABGB12_00895 [Actinocorallia sp. B10E7]|uniref:hypothetical protein n=1 Tax=Actinocorallia sp. B10E7 TaxID=3153558 RepID=UPI00325C916B